MPSMFALSSNMRAWRISIDGPRGPLACRYRIASLESRTSPTRQSRSLDALWDALVNRHAPKMRAAAEDDQSRLRDRQGRGQRRGCARLREAAEDVGACAGGPDSS